MIVYKCARHPDRDARFYCQKTNRWFCAECGATCMAPKAYCKFRTQCVIWALEHDRDGDLLQPDESGKDPERERIEAELEKARQELDEAEKRIPAHSVRPNQVMELEEIEQRIEELERQLGSTGAAP